MTDQSVMSGFYVLCCKYATIRSPFRQVLHLTWHSKYTSVSPWGRPCPSKRPSSLLTFQSPISAQMALTICFQLHNILNGALTLCFHSRCFCLWISRACGAIRMTGVMGIIGNASCWMLAGSAMSVAITATSRLTRLPGYSHCTHYE